MKIWQFLYKCNKCGNELTVKSSIDYPPLTICPKCGWIGFSILGKIDPKNGEYEDGDDIEKKE